MYAGRIVEEGPADGRCSTRPAPVHAGAGGGVPDDRRPGRAVRAARPARRPALARRPADRLPVPSALPRGRSTSAAPTTSGCDAGPAPAGRACLHPGRGEPRVSDAESMAGRRAGPRGRGPARRFRDPRAAGRRGPSTASTWPSAAARSSRWSASRAAARRRWPAPCSAWSAPRPAQVRYDGEPLRYGARGAEGLPPQRAAGAAGPDRLAQPAAHGLRGGRRGAAGPPASPATRSELVAEALSRAGLRPPERYFLRYPHELSGGQRQRVVIAGALVARPAGPRRRRAGLVARRLGARRDPRAAAHAARGPRALGARRHPRPRAGLEHRRPDRGDVPRPHRRDRADRGGARRPAAPLHPGAALGRARDRRTSSRSCSPASRPTPPGCRPAAASTRAARRCASGEAARAGVGDATAGTGDLPRAARPARPRRGLLPRADDSGRAGLLTRRVSSRAGAGIERRAIDHGRLAAGRAARADYVDEAHWRRERDARAASRVVLRRAAVDDLGLDVGRTERLAVVDVAGESVLRHAATRDGRAARALTTSAGTAARRSCRSTRTAAARAVRGERRCAVRYHSWTYDLDGRLLRAPHTEDVEDFDPAAFGAAPGRRRRVGRLPVRCT